MSGQEEEMKQPAVEEAGEPKEDQLEQEATSRLESGSPENASISAEANECNDDASGDSKKEDGGGNIDASADDAQIVPPEETNTALEGNGLPEKVSDVTDDQPETTLDPKGDASEANLPENQSHAVLADSSETSTAPEETASAEVRSPDSGMESLKKSESGEDSKKDPEEQEIIKGKVVMLRGVTGTVRWFNVKHAYGFINRDDIGIDIFVHQTSIKRNNPKRRSRTLGDGEKVEFDIIKGAKGLEAVSVTGPDGAPVIGSQFVYRRPYWNYRRNAYGYSGYMNDRPYGGPPPLRRRLRPFAMRAGRGFHQRAPDMEFQPYDMISRREGMGRGRAEDRGSGEGPSPRRGRSFRNRRKTQPERVTETESESKEAQAEKETTAKNEGGEGNKKRGRRRMRRGKKETSGSEPANAVKEKKEEKKHSQIVQSSATDSDKREEGTQTEQQ